MTTHCPKLSIALLILSLCACGGGSSSATSSTTSGTGTATTTTTETTGTTGTTGTTSTTGSTSTTSTTSTSTTTSTAGSSVSADVYTAAMAFYNTLSTAQQASVQYAWSLDTARKWSNLPASMVARNGVSWGSLSTAQKAAARALIVSALSTAGNDMHTGMQAADDYLNSIGGGSSYGNGNYYIAFLGTPSTTGFWMLQLTGHHLTYNIALNGTNKSPTPLFLAIEPKASFTLNNVTYDPMVAQRTAVGNLGAALTSYASAKLSGTYADILFGANGSGGIDNTCPRTYAAVTDHGLPYTSLSSAHQALAQAVIKAYVNTQTTEYATELLSSYLSSAALAATYVAYTGTGDTATRNNYFRIEGPRLWIEFSVPGGVIVQNDIHYHTIWRDKTADYGGKCVS